VRLVENGLILSPQRCPRGFTNWNFRSRKVGQCYPSAAIACLIQSFLQGLRLDLIKIPAFFFSCLPHYLDSLEIVFNPPGIIQLNCSFSFSSISKSIYGCRLKIFTRILFYKSGFAGSQLSVT
jgi:hypothetical protein